MKEDTKPETLEAVHTHTHTHTQVFSSEKLKLRSLDIVSENIKKIEKIFPNCVTETEDGKKIEFDMLKQELSNDIVEGNKERYQLTWPGKKESILIANAPTSKTLRPVRKKSVDFDNTKNIYIEGDNLEALKILHESYLNKIKCIYIDPPYNTGNDFVYNDSFFNENELEESGQIDKYNNKLITNTDSNGRFHSYWLTMMYSRLKIARDLLTNDGVIAISIDWNENDNLIKICDEIFGEKNFIASIPVLSNPRGRQSSNFIAETHEYCNLYAKNINECKIIGSELSEEQKNEYKYSDERGNYRLLGLRLRGGRATAVESPTLHFPIYYNIKNNSFDIKRMNEDDYEIIPKFEDGTLGTWRWSKEKILKDKKDLIVKSVKDRYDVFQKDYLTVDKRMKPKSLWYEKEINYDRSKDELKKLEMGNYFDYAKPLYLMKKIISMIANNNDIILDFFSGSGTTAHALLELNDEKSLNLQFILIQLPELLPDKSDAYRDGYKTICDIGEERIRRAGKKIKEETNADIDYGFRVYKIDSSNMKDVYYKPTDLQQSQLNMFESNIKEDRTEEDLLTQVILDLGLTLDLSIEKREILNNNVYFVENNSLVACFDDKVDIKIIDEICKCNPLKIVFKEGSFKTDNDKINTFERIKKLSRDTEINII